MQFLPPPKGNGFPCYYFMKKLKISNKEYRALEGISSTDLKQLSKSPAHYKYWKEHPEEMETLSLLLGRAIHKYVLEKDDFFSEFAVSPKCDRRTKAGQAQWLLFEDQNEGKSLLKDEEFQKIKEMRAALYNTQFVSELLEGEKEESYFVKDEKTGLIIKCRPDCLTKIGDTHILIDYKTCQDASTEAFMKAAINLKYDLQMAMYKEIMDKITGFDHSVFFIAQEKTPPYAVNILEANEYFLKSGYDMFRTYLNLYKECLDSGNWYGYTNGEINNLGLPNWLQKQYEGGLICEQ